MLERLRAMFGGRRARPEMAERVRRRAGISMPAFRGCSIETFKRMRKDPQIALGLALLKGPIVGLKWWVESDKQGAGGKEQGVNGEEFPAPRSMLLAERAAELVERQLRPLWRGLTLGAMNALDFGFQAFEKVWVLRGGEVALRKMKDVDPADVEMVADEVGDFAGFRVRATGFVLKRSEFGGQRSAKATTATTDSISNNQHSIANDQGDGNGIFVPAEKAFVFTHGKEFGDLYGRSRLEAVAETWWWSRDIYRQTNQYFERRVNPPIKARAPKGQRTDSDGKVRENLELAESLAEALKAGGTATFPAEFDDNGNPLWDFQYLLDDKRSEMFLSYIEHLDVKKLRGLLVPERAVTQYAGTGSYAMARTHVDVFMQMEQALADEYLDHLNRYVLPQIVLYNLGPRAPVPMLRAKALGEDNSEALRRVVERLFATQEGARAAAGIVDVRKAMEGIGVPVVEGK